MKQWDAWVVNEMKRWKENQKKKKHRKISEKRAKKKNRVSELSFIALLP